ncbi:MAG TPA: hypothetical protein VGO67_12545 [Verrucomicrobiae bacterium]|jgi:hypothetical protein
MNNEQLKKLLRAAEGHLTVEDYDDLDASDVMDHLKACADCAQKAETYRKTVREYEENPQRARDLVARLKSAAQPSRAEVLADVISAWNEKFQQNWAAFWAGVAASPIQAASEQEVIIPWKSADRQLTGVLKLRPDKGALVTVRAWDRALEGVVIEVVLERSPYPLLTLAPDDEGALSASIKIPEDQVPKGPGALEFRLRKKA